MFGISTIINVVEFVLVLSLGIKFNEKWPNAASKVAYFLTIGENFAKWAYSLFKATTPAAPKA